MDSNQFYLFKDRRFLPIFLVQFCGCLNDGILKNALIILITFKLVGELTVPPYILIMFANILFIAPFILCASIAGQVADRYERSIVVKIIKAIEIVLVLLSSYGFYSGNLYILFVCIFLLGMHSAFFGPIKYSVLPDKLKKEELLSANGFIEAGTFLSILFGAMVGGVYTFNNTAVMMLAIVVAITGFIASLFMPNSYNTNRDVKINFNIVYETYKILKYANSKNQLYLAILGISWFWFIGAAILAQIPSLTRYTLGASEGVANLFLAMFSIGVGFGSFLCNRIFASKITTKYVFLAALGISIVATDLYFASKIAGISYEREQLKTVLEFLGKAHYWRILFDLFAIAACGGIYVVPLFTLIQYYSSPLYRSRIIAANNLINSIFMAASNGLLSLLFFLDFSIPSVILLVSILNMVIASYIYQFIPNSTVIPMKLWRAIFRLCVDLVYNVEVRGINNLQRAGKRTVIIANHLSYIDPILIASYLPEEIKFAINLTVSKEWWVRPFLKLSKTYPLEPNNPMAIKSLIKEVKKNIKIAIFPEGRTSVTGSLMKIYEGPGMIADKSDATILPIRIDGTQFTIFSKLQHIMKGKFVFRRKIKITILSPVTLSIPNTIDNKARRRHISRSLYDIMSEMIFQSSDYKSTLFQSIIDVSKICNKNTTIIQDINNNSMNYQHILFKTFLMSDQIKHNTTPGEKIGLMVPCMADSIITFFAMQAIGRIPVMINYTTDSNNVISACHTAQVKIIYSFRKFIKTSALELLVNALKVEGITVQYLEDIINNSSLWSRFKSWIASYYPQGYYENICIQRNDLDTAVILFTSGTEGKQKAVALSHRNIQANRYQVLSRIDISPNDIAFNSLPLFYSFGLIQTLIMSLMGVKTFLYPSPLDYRKIPEIIYDIAPTIMFNTNSLLESYAVHAQPYDFYSLRYVISGGEILQEKTRKIWLDKFGIRIFASYGTTEASPSIAINTPMYNKSGTVGKLLPKIIYHLQPIQGIKDAGKLYIKGPNVMQGYMLPNNPGVIQKTIVSNLGEGWYNTGDIVSMDNDGYVTIIGKETQCITIAGQTILLTYLEDMLTSANSAFHYAAVPLQKNKQTNQHIVLFTTHIKLKKDYIYQLCQKKQLSTLYIPTIIVPMTNIPLLMTGKFDYGLMLKIAQDKIKSMT